MSAYISSIDFQTVCQIPAQNKVSLRHDNKGDVIRSVRGLTSELTSTSTLWFLLVILMIDGGEVFT